MKHNQIKSAIEFLQQGKVIAFPTETVYGLGCDPRDAKAVKQIVRLKGRPKDKSLLLVASSFAQVREVAVLRGPALTLAKKYWPGPLSLILPAKHKKGTVGIRISSSPIVQKLTRGFGFPIIATSANRSGEEPARSTEEVLKIFGKRIPFVINGGKLIKRKSSTLVRCHDDGTIEIRRQGAIRL